MKKTLFIALFALVGTASANTILESAINSLESSYGLICSNIVDNSSHCYIEGDKHHGLDLELVEKKKTTKLIISSFNDSEGELYKQIFKKQIDGRYFGQTLAKDVVAAIDASDDDVECSEVHDNVVGKKQNMVLNPWWQTVMKSECFSSKGQTQQITVNLGSINKNGFIKSIKIDNL